MIEKVLRNDKWIKWTGIRLEEHVAPFAYRQVNSHHKQNKGLIKGTEGYKGRRQTFWKRLR